MNQNGEWDDSENLDPNIRFGEENPEAWMAAPQGPRRAGRLRILSIDELLDLPARDYLVKGWMSRDEISLIVGTKNTRKTFFALHAGYAIAQGRLRLFGRRVHQAPGIYLVAEGERGIGKRVTALVNRYGKCRGFHVIAQPVDLLRSTASGGDLRDVIAAVKMTGSRWIVVDTISRALAGGNENGPDDMGQLLHNLTILRSETGAHVCGVHHGSQAQGTKSRGHSSLPFGVEVILQIEWDDATGIGMATLGFARDDACGPLGSFRTTEMKLGTDDDGDPITTLLIDETDDRPAPARQQRLTTIETLALRALDVAVHEQGFMAPMFDEGAESLVVRADQWRDTFYRDAKPTDDRKTKEKAFRRAAEALDKKRRVKSRDGFVCPIGPTGR